MMVETKFDIKERVIIDDDTSLSGVITVIQFRADRSVTYGVSYIHNGASYENLIEEYRLQHADGRL